MGDKEKLSYRPDMVLQGVYKSYGPRFGFLITDEDHEDVYIADRDHLNAVNNDIVEVRTKKERRGVTIRRGKSSASLKERKILLSALMR